MRKIALSLLFLSLLGVLGSTFMLTETLTPYHWEWGIYGSCLVLFLSNIVVLFFRQQSSEQLLLKYKETKIHEDGETLQKLQKDFESKLNLLAQQEKDVKQKLMQYKQYAEFPNEKTTTVGSEDKTYFDDEIAQLLHDKAEIIFDKIINKKYTKKTVFKHQLLLEDIVDLIESVARIHHPESQNPLLETSIENLFRSLNRVSLQLLVLIDSFPINIKEYNLRKTYLYIQKSATTIGYYKKAEPFLTFASPLLRIGMASNPLVGVAQVVAYEAGKQAIKTGSEKYALNLLHDVIEIIGEQASTIFGDTSLRYRSKDWIYAVELTELMYHFNPVEPEVLVISGNNTFESTATMSMDAIGHTNVLKISSDLPKASGEALDYLFDIAYRRLEDKNEEITWENLRIALNYTLETSQHYTGNAGREIKNTIELKWFAETTSEY